MPEVVVLNHNIPVRFVNLLKVNAVKHESRFNSFASHGLPSNRLARVGSEFVGHLLQLYFTAR